MLYNAMTNIPRLWALAAVLLSFASASPLPADRHDARDAAYAFNLAQAEADAPATPIQPSLDPWYRAPDGWEAAAPGAVLRVRRAPYLALTLANVLSAWHILYRTTDSARNATWAVTTLLVPQRHYRCRAAEEDACAHSLLSYQTPYDAAHVDAGPSYALHAGEVGGAYGEIAEALFRGWFVSVPDYEGPTASYTAGVMSGLATVDSVRAVLALAGSFGLRSADAKVAMWGYSGGALASEWAAGGF
jgi:hypothetical protein